VLRLIGTVDAQRTSEVLLNLRVSLIAVTIVSLIALPLGALLATARFPGRQAMVAVLIVGGNIDGVARNIEPVTGAIHAGSAKIIISTRSLGKARRLGDKILF